MEIKSLPEALKVIMRQHGWTQRELGQRLGMSQVWVSQVTRGQKDSGVANMIQRLARVGWELVIRPKREDQVKRRHFLAVATSVALAPGSQAVPYRDAEYVRTLATRLSTGFYDRGGILILPEALRHAQQLRPALDGSDRALQSAASEAVTWAAWVAYDAQRFDTAEHLGRLALVLGERAGDQEAQAAACSALSRITIDCHRLNHSVAYARRGAALPDITPERRAWLNMRLGRALALLGGHEHAAREALANAQSITEYMSDVVDTADLAHNIGEGLTNLRAFDDAHASLNEALTLSKNRSPRIYASGIAKQAKAALHAADPEFAADRMFGLARVVPLVSSSRVENLRNELLTLSSQWEAIPEMRTAREHLSSVMPATRA